MYEVEEWQKENRHYSIVFREISTFRRMLVQEELMFVYWSGAALLPRCSLFVCWRGGLTGGRERLRRGNRISIPELRCAVAGLLLLRLRGVCGYLRLDFSRDCSPSLSTPPKSAKQGEKMSSPVTALYAVMMMSVRHSAVTQPVSTVPSIRNAPESSSLPSVSVEIVQTPRGKTKP